MCFLCVRLVSDCLASTPFPPKPSFSLCGWCVPQDIPADIVLSIEYLDYALEAKPRLGTDRMPASRRALHSVSRLLADMPAIVNPAIGRAAAVRSCEELAVCIVGLRNEVSLWLLAVGCGRRELLLLQLLLLLCCLLFSPSPCCCC